MIVSGIVTAKVKWDAAAEPDYWCPLPHDAFVECATDTRIGDLYDANTGVFTSPPPIEEEPIEEE